MLLFSLFRVKKKHPEYLFSKTINYKGYDISVYCLKDEDIRRSIDKNVYFKTGWRVKGNGEYNTGIIAEGIDDNIMNHIEAAKKHVDSMVNAPSEIEKAIQLLNNIDIK